MAAPGLLRLPADVLRMLWDRLGEQTWDPSMEGDEDTQKSRAQDQHALRSTCKQLRDAVTPWIMSLGVAFHFHTEEALPWPELLGGAVRQLAAFPAAATLRSLRWSYVELNPGDPEGVLSVSLPQLLPNFFVDARARLGAVQHATFLGQLDLGYGEISGLVDACPHLQALTIEDCPVARHALAPLARLPLRSLTLTDVDIPGDAHWAGSYECLTLLRSLTRLDVGPLPGDLLPQLSGLPSLLNLRLTLSTCTLDRELDLHHLSHLTQLTSLSLFSYDPLGPNLALPPTLVLLHLPHSSLGSDAIELISGLPRLSELLAEELAPDRDFSHAVCSFTQLSLRFCSSPLRFTYLPLGSVTRLCMASQLHAGLRPQRCCEVDWRLDATRGLPDACATLTRACEILARAMVLNGIHEDEEVRLQLTLRWKPAPPATSVQILEALSPLSELCRRPSAFRLVLGDGFQVSSEHVDRLASVLPNLSSLQVIDSMLFSAPPGFSSFATALGTHMPRLRSFGVCQGDEIALDIMPREIEDALLAMAALRARAGTPLTIYVGPGTSEQQLERWNSLMAVIRRDVGQMQQNQVLFQGMPHSDGDPRDRDDRGRGRDDRDRRSSRDERGGRDDRGRDRDSGRDRDRDRDRGRDRSRERSRSRGGDSPPPGPRKNRKTKFDILPAGMTAEQAAALLTSTLAAASDPVAAAVMSATMPGALPGPPPMPGAGLGAVMGLGAAMGIASSGAFSMPIPGMAGSTPSSNQATRHARRVYVGGLPPTANEQSIATFFSHALSAIGGNTAGPGNAVVNVYINREKNFSFVEFRTVEECSNAMALDGIMFEGVSVRVRRPNDYNPAAAVGLGASGPNPNLNLAAIGLGGPGGVSAPSVGGMTTGSAADAAERIFVGGLPYYLTEEQCRELLGSFGTIKSFDLVKDKETGTGKGYGFVVYSDPAVTDIAIAGLNGLKMGDRTLTVRRAAEGANAAAAGGAAPVTFQAVPTTAAAMAAAAAAAVAGVSIPGLSFAGAPAIPGATNIVVLADAVTLEEITNEEEYNDILEDMRDECGKHGPVTNILIPRPLPDNPNPAGLAKVIIEFGDINAAVRARNAMHGRRFAGRTVGATFLSEEAYSAGQYDA